MSKRQYKFLVVISPVFYVSFFGARGPFGEGYRELYFDTGDHTDNIDWSGYTVGNTLHALSTIFLAQ